MKCFANYCKYMHAYILQLVWFATVQVSPLARIVLFSMRHKTLLEPRLLVVRLSVILACINRHAVVISYTP